MTVGSLFSGIGGLDLGLEWAGFETKWFCEIEPFPQQVLKKHWPNTPIYNDVREITADTVIPVDVIAGGFPCQDISWAGRGRGIDYDLSEQEGTRSGLWWEMWRVIRDLRPRYVIAENVPALTHRGLDIVLGSLAQIGYDAEWQTISAASVGAPHIRERVFIVAYPTGERTGRGSRVIQETNGRSGEWVRQPVESGASFVAYRNNTGLEGQSRDGSKVNEPRRVGARQNRQAGGSSLQPDWFGGPTGQPWPVSFKMGDTERKRLEGAGGEPGESSEPSAKRWVEVEYDFRGVAYGVSDRVGALKGYGNAVVPQVGYLVGRAVMAHAQDTGGIK